ncbi:MAG: hypothetical protein A2V67_04905 [Deltaproteobacteria bacterium RBG_13_61_14]|nr:MAG: hypothetical protein A2V67_04905 [Deltaproteobacteria bacterium RBG_13_61_14]
MKRWIVIWTMMILAAFGAYLFAGDELIGPAGSQARRRDARDGSLAPVVALAGAPYLSRYYAMTTPLETPFAVILVDQSAAADLAHGETAEILLKSIYVWWMALSGSCYLDIGVITSFGDTYANIVGLETLIPNSTEYNVGAQPFENGLLLTPKSGATIELDYAYSNRSFTEVASISNADTLDSPAGAVLPEVGDLVLYGNTAGFGGLLTGCTAFLDVKAFYALQ